MRAALLFACASVALASPFSEYLTRFGKSYSAQEYPLREAAFTRNMRLITEHNARCDELGCSSRMGVNKVSLRFGGMDHYACFAILLPPRAVHGHER